MPKKLICVFSKSAPCGNPRRHVFCRIAKMFLPLDEIITSVGKALDLATTGELPEGIEFEDLPEKFKELLRRKDRIQEYRV